MRNHSKQIFVSLAALALSASVLLTGCSDGEEASSASSAADADSKASTTETAPTTTQPTGATAAQTSELLASLTSTELEQLLSGETSLAELEKQRFSLPETTASSDASTPAASSKETGTAPAAAETPEPAATESVSSYDAELQDLINELYAVKARAESSLNSAIQSAKSEYRALPANEKTSTKKLSIVMSKSSELQKLQASCDKEVNSIVARMRKLLKENGQSTALADQALASYEAQKSSAISTLKSQVLG